MIDALGIDMRSTGQHCLESVLIATATAILFLTATQIAVAWSNGGYSSDPQNPDYGTHDWIADAALTMQTLDVTFLTATYHAEFLLGTEAPDNPAYIGDSVNHHVYYYSSGVLQDDKCADRASETYQVALGYLTSGDLSNAAFYIGALTHYVADVGVFGHTMGAVSDWGAETHHSDYETAIESMIGSLSPPTGIPLGNADAYSATIGLADIITFGSGAVKTNVWMDANYNWADATFEQSATASLYGAVAAVAAVVNHLLIEAGTIVPEFGSPVVVVLVVLAVMVVVLVPRLRPRLSGD